MLYCSQLTRCEKKDIVTVTENSSGRQNGLENNFKTCSCSLFVDEQLVISGPWLLVYSAIDDDGSYAVQR